jgi:hypothetical protein
LQPWSIVADLEMSEPSPKVKSASGCPSALAVTPAAAHLTACTGTNRMAHELNRSGRARARGCVDVRKWVCVSECVSD